MAYRQDMAPVARPAGPHGMSMLRALAARDGGRVLDFFTRTAAASPTVAHLRVPGEHVYVLSDPALVREVLVAHGRHTVKSRGLENAKILVGEGLLTSEGELHRRNRRLVQPAFAERRMAPYASVMVAEAAALDRRWDERITPDGAVVDMAAEMARLTLTVAGRTLFGVDLSEQSSEVATGLADSLAVFRRTLLPGGRLMLLAPLPSSRRALRARVRLDQLVRHVVDERRLDGAGDRGDVLSVLLAARDDDVPMPDQQVRDEVMTLLIAGHETTAVALTWTWWLLAGHPRAASAVQNELTTVVGDRAPEPADVGRLPVTTAAVAEAMRLYPPAWVLGRRLTSEAVLDGWHVPARSVCVSSQWILHRDARFWTDPLVFEPSRWLGSDGGFDEHAPGQPRGAWFPFGMGARSCVGEGFAWTETVLVLATLARRWAPERVDDRPPRLDPAVTLRPTGGLPMRLRRR